MTKHYYEYVAAEVTWHEARQLASQRTYQGEKGYLATIPTVRENLFLTSNFATPSVNLLAWIGAYEPNNDAAWVWSDGPEAGERFSQSEHPVFPSYYVNWGGIEPDSGALNEDFVVINLGLSFAGIGTGEWAAVAVNPSGTNAVRGFLVEYGGLTTVPEPPTTVIGIVAVNPFLSRRSRSRQRRSTTINSLFLVHVFLRRKSTACGSR